MIKLGIHAHAPENIAETERNKDVVKQKLIFAK